MRVRITKQAFIDGSRRKPGEIVDVPAPAKGKSLPDWMVPVEAGTPVKADKPAKGKAVKSDGQDAPAGDGGQADDVDDLLT